jgi:NDP-sugar pyrophosphorylase family protein
MKHIIILSGHSQRFLDKGYTIKPLIKIGNKTIIEYVADTLNLKTFNDVIFLIKKEDVNSYNLDTFLEKTFPQCKIKQIDSHFNGPVYSVLQAEDIIDDISETLITYCDLYIKWNIQAFYDHIKMNNVDGSIVTHTGWHPHRLYNTSFAYLKVEGDNVIEVREKQHFTDKPEDEYASGGIYYFKTGAILKKYFKDLIEKNIRVNNEFYVTMPFNLMINDGLKVTHFDSKNYVCLGTPKDVEIFNSCVNLYQHLDNSDSIISSWNYFYKILNTTA